jgi:ribonuclease BN (tRNA processing enzyme)
MINLRLVLIFGLAAVLAVAWAAAFVIYRAAELNALVGPLEERDFDSLTVIAVGTGGGYENPERLGPSTGVAWGREIVLVDAGRGVAEALRHAGIPVRQPRTILLTNLLPLNTLGLDDLLYTGWLEDREDPLRVLGPPGTAALVEGLLAAHREGSRGLGHALPLNARGADIEVEEVGDGYLEELGNVIIRARGLPGGPVPALAWRFERGERRVVISGTGWGAENLADFAREADLLIHEAVFVPPPEDIENMGVIADPERLIREAALHTSIEDVGELATRARAQALMLVRMRPPPFYAFQIEAVVGQTYDGTLHLPEDGEEIVP